MTTAEAKRLAEFDACTGAERLRRVVNVLNNCREDFADPYTPAQLIQLVRMHIASDWDFTPDEWGAAQRRDAIAGKPPRWGVDEKPVFE